LKDDLFTIPFEVEAFKTRRMVMRIFIVTAVLLLSFATLSATKAEPDMSPNIPREAVEAFLKGIETGTLWEAPKPSESVSPETHMSRTLINAMRDPIETPEGRHDWLSPAEAISYAAAGVELDQPLPTTTPWIKFLDPDGEFHRQLREGLFVDTLDRDSRTAHQLFIVMNSHSDTPNLYLVVREQAGLGSLDKMYSIVSDNTQLSTLDPKGNFPRIARIIPEIKAVSQDTSFTGKVMAWFKLSMLSATED
jgi:hypothetical protein